MKIKFIKRIFFGCLIFVLAYFTLSFFYFEKEIGFNNQERSENFNNSEINLFFVGDIMLGRGVEYMISKKGEGDFRFPFLKIADELKESDLLFGNLEGPISDKGVKVGSIYSFRFNPKAIEGLIYAGFDILSLANNHMFDYQRIALEDTMNILKENNINYVRSGLDIEEAFSLKIRQVKDTKIGFLGYINLGPENWRARETSSGLAWIDQDSMDMVKEHIKESKQDVDVLIVSLHAGEEYAENPTNFQISFAQDCINGGADLVVQHHSHVVQAIERYNDGWVAYSLGNFIFDQHFSKETMESIILKVVIDEKEIKKVYTEDIKINQYFQPELIIEN